MTYIAEYVKDGFLIQVYSENGKRTVSITPYKKEKPKAVRNGYLPKKEKKVED